MSIFQHIDRDKVVRFMAYYWWNPFHYWFYGNPDEPAFLHDLFRHCRMNPNPWDIGLRTPVFVHHQVAQLHQQGLKRTDKFGSDFGFTIDITGNVTLRKTAIFQTKLGDNCTASVERDQLREALSVPELAGRAFTMALDRPRKSIRIQSVDILAAAFLDPKHATKSFDTTEWLPSSEWMLRWFECEVGRPSSPFEPSSIEALLSAHILEAPDDFPRYESRQVGADRRQGDHVFIPDVWHHTTIHIG